MAKCGNFKCKHNYLKMTNGCNTGLGEGRCDAFYPIKLDREKSGACDGYTSRLIKAAKDVFNWYYIFGEDSDAAKEHLAELGNAIENYESREV